MKIQSLKTIIYVTITSFSLVSVAGPKTTCHLSDKNPKPPQVILYPDSGLNQNDEVQVDLVIPTLSANGSDTKRFLKIKDVDGSVSAMLSLYLAQNTKTNPSDIDPLIVQALKKRLAYWEADLKKQQSKPPITPNSGVDPLLIENSLASNRLLLKEDKNLLSTEERKMIITEILGTMTDYDKTFKYEYREFENGKFVSKGAKRLADILPPELYQSASSTSGYGLIKEQDQAGKTNCEFLPVLGRLPKAGDVKSIRRPGQR